MPAPAQPQTRTGAASVSLKRKRADTSSASLSLPSTVENIVDVLENYDTTPSLLNYTLPLESASETTAPSSKRHKPAGGQEQRTIISKARAHLYTDLSELSKDVDASTAAVLSASEPSDETDDPSLSNTASDQLHAQSNALQKVLRTLIAQQCADDAHEHVENGVKAEADDTVNGSATAQAVELGNNTVLTLFGNAQGAKQLFSSSQKPMSKKFLSDKMHANPGLTAAIAECMPLHEHQLPTGINSTKILSITPQIALPPARRRLKFFDTFKPRASLPQLTPPKPLKRSATRDSTITWTREPSRDPTNKVGYTNENLPTGQWLGYSGVSTSQEPQSPEAKRRQRARTLSTGESIAEASENAKAAQAQAKEDALFRSVYSSFAPSIDDSDALVPEEIKDDVWWERIGEWHYGHMFAPDESMDEEQDTNMAGASEEDLEESALKEVVESFDPILWEEDGAKKGEDDSGNTDDVLSEISDLLESLLSHQRIRNSSLRPSASQSSSTASTSPPEPSADEVKVYESLRSKLASLVTQLPPYVLSKVHGDQLSDLIVSRHILMEGHNYPGVMEEDQASRLAAAAALNSALGNQQGGRSTPGQRPSQSTPAARPGSGYNAGPGSSRVAPAAQRAPLSAWQTPAQQYASSGGQRGVNQSAAYNRPLMSGYGQQRPSGGQVNGAYASQPQYQQRAQQRDSNSRVNYPYGPAGASGSTPGMTGPQQLYQAAALQRPAGGYYPQSPMASQINTSGLNRGPNKAQQPSMAGGMSPHAPAANGSRPHTPATPSQTHAQTPKGAAGSP